VFDAACDLGASRAGRGDAASSESELVDRSRHVPVERQEADEALALLHSRFEQTQDPAIKEEIAEEALDLVERQLTAARDWRGRLDSLEGSLWARRNRIERFLIGARGRAWWRARRERAGRCAA
jgi:hypothetical protein